MLAGGRSSRMGVDKAFLKYCGRSFIEIVVGRALSLGGRVVVCVGGKDKSVFEALLPKRVKVLNDVVELGTPLSGLITGFRFLGWGMSALLGCDMPLVKVSALRHLAGLAQGHSAAVPRWPGGDVEPLFAVYDVRATLGAAELAVRAGRLGLRHLLGYLPDVRYVDVGELRVFDPELESLFNVNTPEDYRVLLAREDPSRCGELLGEQPD